MTPSIRGFKLVFTTIGVIYTLMASSMLVRGVGALREFGVPESDLSSPVFADVFNFFYLLMAYIGVLTVLLGHVTKERRAQLLVACVFCLTNLLTALRDLSTSDSRFGNRLYHGDKTMVFVYISLVFAAAYGYVIVAGLRTARRQPAGASDAGT
ncbi:MAG: hypothetical protein OXU20_22730 [Myxococcales bacterium]|nr:hypothetical protein [Myxococcales bacterium]